MNVVITGAGRGIGYELVRKFASVTGNKIIALSRNKQNLENLKNECSALLTGSELMTCSFDLEHGNYDALLQDSILPFFKSVDILVNNAGYLINSPFEALTDQDFDRIFNVNVKGAVKITRLLFPCFSSGSHIINVSSMGGYQGSVKFPGLSLYSSAKGAMAILTECLAEEFKSRKINVNCLAIGAVQTEMLQEAFPGYQAPLKPTEMAEFMFDFAMHGHRFFNGKILPVSVSTP
jgi:NAD(P)-dependent dehydrogenase (short-subunit alcohol dehydrogenase family)